VVFSQLRRQKADRLFIVIGFVAEKDLEKIFGYMPKNAYYFFTQASTERALSAQKLAEKCKSLGFEGEIHMNVGAALEAYKRIQKAGDLLFIGGSTFIVADAINFLENRDNFFAD
jgi:dihydrofolate synthase/folylpolyglutamate synthase